MSNQNLDYWRIVFKYSCNAISQGQSLEIANKVIEFDNLCLSNGSYSSEEEQEDVEMLTTECQSEQKYE